MIFKKIEMYGFKSFADRQEIKFDGGITVIVGPNGCGKSNIADAIRWVQGEQSSKLLRGKNMQDVIFNGTEKRKSLGFCEVSIFFDNTEKIIPIDYNEIVVTRKLYRNGESEYQINREECRLKDIVNLLRDIGIGKEGYSIIGQGQVDKIISSKPEDRRAIFEEAAGISKHKQIKVESERKLERTQENLTRITDIRAEIERQYHPLQKQAESAKEYLQLKEQLKQFEVNSFIYQHERTAQIKAEINSKIKNAQDEIGLKQKQIDDANKSYSNVLRDLNEADMNQKKYNDEILQLTVLLEKTSGETRLAEAKLEHLNEQKSKLETDLNNFKLMDKLASEQYAEKEKLTEQKTIKIEELNAKAQEVSNEYLRVVGELTEGEDAVENSQKQMIESLGSLGDIKAEEGKCKAELKSLQDREISLKNEIAELSIKIEESSKFVNENEADFNNICAGVDQFDGQSKKLIADINKLEDDIARGNEEYSKGKAKLFSMQSRLKMLKDLQAENEGYAYSVRKLLEAGKADPQIKCLFIGTVAELFKTEEKFEVAMEMALASSVQNVVTENEENAKKIIEFLKINKLGRATMLPLTSVKPRYVEARFLNAIKRNSYGVASDLISFDKKYSNVFEMLLGGTVVCETLDDAVSLARETGYSFKIVSLDGEIINPTGSISGGSRKNEGTSIISRAREIEALEIEIQNLSKIVLKLENAIQNSSKQKQELSKQQELANDKFTMLQIEKTRLGQELNLNKQILSESTEEKNASKDELEKTLLGQRNCESLLIKLKDAMQNLESKKVDAGENIEKRQKQFDNLKKQKDVYNESITTIKVQISALESELNSLSADCERIVYDRENYSVKINEHIENLKKVEKEIVAVSQISFDLKNENEQDANKIRLRNLTEKVEKLSDFKAETQSKLADIEEDRLKLTAILNKVQDKKFNEEVALTKVDTDLEFLQERIFSEYELTYETAVQYRKEGYNFEEGEKQISKLKKDIYKLGAVNVNAIEDVRELEIRLNEYKTQEEDLLKARNDLLKVIKELTSEMTEKFAKEFFVISQNFSRIFKELFGGGNAKLILCENPNDPLNEGIDIVAEPPGKKLQSITLLSGGEKALTAIAILFAILRLRPMPFCVLDEIEAALDEANVGRFAHYLRHFSEESQFIVISHRKPTMEEADNLYGVTMEEKGVSKLVSVKLNDVKE